MPKNESSLLWIILAVVIVLHIILIPGLIYFLNDFSQELRYINNEIGRSTGKEKEHWLRRRRRLWLSILPFFRY